MVGPRAAELAGLQIGDVFVPDPSLNPNAPVKQKFCEWSGLWRGSAAS
jgi:hypothetical protein